MPKAAQGGDCVCLFLQPQGQDFRVNKCSWGHAVFLTRTPHVRMEIGGCNPAPTMPCTGHEISRTIKSLKGLRLQREQHSCHGHVRGRFSHQAAKPQNYSLGLLAASTYRTVTAAGSLCLGAGGSQVLPLCSYGVTACTSLMNVLMYAHLYDHHPAARRIPCAPSRSITLLTSITIGSLACP